MKFDPHSDLSFRDQWAKNHATIGIKNVFNSKLKNASPDLQLDPDLKPIGDKLPKAPTLKPKDLREVPEAGLKVCIVGAGAAGLFTGLIFDYLYKATGGAFNVGYDIIEAAGKDRVGGRLYSYYFDNTTSPGPHDYYDVGAMRFPENPIMAR
jgi:hypothetical protein